MKIKLILISLILATSFALHAAFPPPVYVPASGLQGYWPFNGNAVDESTSFGTYNGTVYGATPSTDRFGNANSAYCFNGTSDYISTTFPGISGTNARAVSFWAKTSTDGPLPGMYCVGWGANGGGSSGVYGSATGDRFGCGVGANGSSPFLGASNSIVDYPVPTATSDGQWHHYVFQFAGGASQPLNSVQVYMDAVLYPGTTIIGSGFINTVIWSTVQFGRIDYATQPAWFNGCLDEIGIWDRTLTLCEIYNLYNGALGCNPPNEPPQPTGCCLGNLCTASQNALTGNYEIPLNNFNFNFSGTNAEKVNTGYACSNNGIGKLNSITAIATNQNSSTGLAPKSISIFGENYFSSSGTGVGVMGKADSQGSNLSVGVLGDAVGTGNNIGGKFYAGTNHPGPNTYQIGVSTVAKPVNGNSPLYTYTFLYPGGANIGIYATGELNNTSGGTPGPDWAGWFDGDVNINGVAYCTGMTWGSDKRFKNNVQQLKNVSEKLARLKGYSYDFKHEEFKTRSFPKGSQLGVLAQEVQEVFPELVLKDNQGYLSVNYIGLIPVLLEGFKDQQQQINELKAMVTTLISGSTRKEDSPGKATTSTQSIDLHDKNVVVLNQNVPNPFAENTVITYNIPDGFVKAEIIFTGTNGSILKTVDIKEKGSGALTIYASDLSNGTYSYSLIIDGKTVATKKMIKQ